MADIGASNWSETDASNNTASPDGAPEGMAPSGLNDTMRAIMGATKRWYDWSIPKTTGGTSTAYTLSYTVAPGSLVDGMTHLVQFNAVNGAAPTLNVNSLGAKPLHFYCGGSWAACPANMFAVDQVVQVTYNSGAGTYRCIGLPLVLNQTVAAASSVDFTGIPSNVNHLEIRFGLLPATDNVGLQFQAYNSGGSLDTGSVYNTQLFSHNSSTTTGVTTGSGATSITLATSISNNASIGCTGVLNVQDIQAVKDTNLVTSTYWVATGATLLVSATGGGARHSNGPITGFRLIMTSGNLTGKVSVNMR